MNKRRYSLGKDRFGGSKMMRAEIEDISRINHLGFVKVVDGDKRCISVC